jgi:hypothetical protein
MDSLVMVFGIDLDKLEIDRKRPVRTRGGGAIAWGEVADPLLDWLSASGQVVADRGGDFIDIICPWASEHTTGDNTAGYSPLGRGHVQGDIDLGDTRAFKCQHEHCKDRDFKEFKAWAVAQGAPDVAGYDPLARLQGQYVHVVEGEQVVDMIQRPLGGKWRYTLREFSNMHYGRMTPPGRKEPVLIKSAFLGSPRTRAAKYIGYVPTLKDTGLVKVAGQQVVNSYIAPAWPEIDKTPDVFLEHIEYLLPDMRERECFLDWLAHKIQHPEQRSFAVVMIVPDGTQGIGRSWLGNMLQAMLSKTGDDSKVNTVDLDKLSGKQNFNDYLFGCQFLIVEEAKDVAPEEYWSAYETLKERVEPGKEKRAWRNTKYGAARYDNMWFNALVFSNHVDAIALPDEDRRFCVLTNATERRDPAYYERLHGSLRGEEPARLYWWLRRRDISGFDHVYPIETEGRDMMVELARSPSEEIGSVLLEDLVGDLVIFSQLRSRVRDLANQLGHSKVADDPDPVAKRIWKGLKKLRKDKNGARYSVDGKTQEVRAARNTKNWQAADSSHDRDAIVAEAMKNASEVVSFHTLAQFPTLGTPANG